MNFLQLCQDFAPEIGYSAPSSVTGQTGDAKDIVDMIAKADVEIQNLWQDWTFLSSENNTPYSQTLTIGQTAYTKPADLGVWDEGSFFLDYTTDDYYHLHPLDYDEWRAYYRNGVQTNDVPTRIVIDKNKDLILWPPPDSARTLTGEYTILPTRMTGNTDVSPIPVQFHRIIVLKAKIFFGEINDAPEIYEAANHEYKIMMDQLEAYALPDQGRRRKARDNDPIVVRPE